MAYIKYPAEAVETIFGDNASDKPAKINTLPEQSVNAIGKSDDDIAAGRSIYYGFVLYAGSRLGGLWIPVLFQLVCAATAVWLTLDAAFGPGDRRSFPIVLGLLGLMTPLSFYISYLMPDVFTGVAILAIANLIAFDLRMQPAVRIVWFLLLAAAIIFHTSHMAISMLLLVPAVALAFFLTRRLPLKGIAAIGLALLCGVLGEALFFTVVESVYGDSPLRPPFLMARLIADGPGYDYLVANCPQVGLEVCNFLPRLPVGSDEFLWSKDPALGVYGAAESGIRRRLGEEQLDFVIGVLAFDPVGQLKASLGDFLEQISRFGVNEFAYTPTIRSVVAENLTGDARNVFLQSGLYKETFPLWSVDAVLKMITLVSAVYLLGMAAASLLGFGSKRAPVGEQADSASFAVLMATILLGVVANAAVTGILSTPHERYQARVIWLVPLAAALVFLRRRAVEMPGRVDLEA